MISTIFTFLLTDGDRPKPVMRRGVLMTMLQQNASTLPLWIGKPGQRYREWKSILLKMQL